MDFDVFISYASQDKATADAACAQLEAGGIRCWIAPRDVPPGAEWAEAVVDAIDHCRVMVLIFSSSTNASRQIRREVQRGFDREVPVMPFRIENVPPEKALAYYIGSVHWLDALTPPLEQHLQKLADSIRPFARSKPTGDKENEEPVLRETETRRREEEERRQRDEERLRKTAAEVERQRLESYPTAAREVKEKARQERERKKNEENEGRRAEAKLRAEQKGSLSVAERADSADAEKQEPEPREPWQLSRTLLTVGGLGAVLAGAFGVRMWVSTPTHVQILPSDVPPLTSTQPSPPSSQTQSSSIGPLSPERERALKQMDSFQECAGCPEMVVIPTGQYLMGSSEKDIDNGIAAENEGPQHKVVIAQPIAVSRFEVTRDEFETFVGSSGYKIGDRCYTFENNLPQERTDRSFRNPGFAQTSNHPAVCVNWTDAKAYVVWLSQKTGKPYRLLSESEWEYVARGGSASRYGFGNDATELCKFANGADQSAKLAKLPGDYAYMDCNDGYAYTAPVGSFSANAWGLFDSLGNVWELTEDCYADDYGGALADGSPLEVANCAARTARGGSWFSNAAMLRPAIRAKADPTARHDDLGFRVARPLVP